MPSLVPMPVPAAPYDVVNDALNLARTRINDAIQSIGGDMLTNTQPFTQVMANAGWRKAQAYLASLGYSRVRKRVTLTGFPAVGSTDPASETILNWSWFFDGVSFFYPPDTPVLPQDFIAPLRIGERQSVGFQAVLTQGNAGFSPVQLSSDGNPDLRKSIRNGWFDWRNDEIVMPGSLRSMDLQIYYAAYLPDFATVAEIQWYNQPIPILRSTSAFANYIAAEFAGPRGDMDAQAFVAAAEQDCRVLYNNSDVPLKQRNNISRRSYGGGCGRGYGF